MRDEIGTVKIFYDWRKIKMKKLTALAALLLTVSAGTTAFAQTVPSQQNRHKIALKNGMNLNNSFIFVKTYAFIPRFT